MKKWFLGLILIGVVLVSGCVEQEEDKQEPQDNVLKMEYEVTEKIEKTRILPGQSIRMIVYLTSQVDNDTTNVSMTISNPYGIEISRVDCGHNCVCPDAPSSCPGGVSCYYNGCHYDTIQDYDLEEINFALNVPTEEEITSVGYELKPELTLEYDYGGESTIYIPILRYGEKPIEVETEFGQTKGPIHVDIRSDKWVRDGSIFPLFVEVKDVMSSGSKITINRDNFQLFHNDYIYDFGKDEDNNDTGRCDFNPNGNPKPNIDIDLPMKDPLVCTLKSKSLTAPMVKALIRIEYSYRYKIEKTETIRVEKGLF